MGLSADDMSALAGLGDAAPDVAAPAAAARARWNGLRVTVVDALDVRGETPALETALPPMCSCWVPTATAGP